MLQELKFWTLAVLSLSTTALYHKAGTFSLGSHYFRYGERAPKTKLTHSKLYCDDVLRPQNEIRP